MAYHLLLLLICRVKISLDESMDESNLLRYQQRTNIFFCAAWRSFDQRYHTLIIRFPPQSPMEMHTSKI